MPTIDDMKHAISTTLGDCIEDFDIDGIADAIRAEFETTDIDNVPSDRYWEIVRAHDKAVVAKQEKSAESEDSPA